MVLKNNNHLIIKHGFRETKVCMGLILEKPLYLQLKKQRFYCKKCGQTFTAQTPYIEPRCRISKDVKLMLMKKLTKVSSEKDLANSELLKHLSFDEFKSTKDVDGTMSFIYCDSITHDIIDILPDRHQFKLKEYFLRFSRKQRKNVKSISIDMYVPYISLIKSLFPEAEIIINRFHIV